MTALIAVYTGDGCAELVVGARHQSLSGLGGIR